MNEHGIVNSFYENGTFLFFYQILKVNRTASSEEIKKNYHTLSKIYHPDSKQGNVEMMQKIGLAYRILKNQDTKNLYDSYYIKQGEKNTAHSTSDSHQPKHTFSGVNTGSNQFSWNYICKLLRKCHYSDRMIQGFIAWCQNHSISISSGSELSSRFKEYRSFNREEAKVKKTNFEDSSQPRYHVFNSNRFNYYPASDSFYYRQMMIRQMMVASLLNSYFESSISMSPRVSNLEVYSVFPNRMTLYPYIPASRVVFYSKPKIKYYYCA